MVKSVVKTQKYRPRPQPLNTIELLKIISRKLMINSKDAMESLEDLYQQGLISYPRTETTIYNPTINLREIVIRISKLEKQNQHKDLE